MNNRFCSAILILLMYFAGSTKVNAQIVAILDGENCNDHVTLVKDVPPLIPAVCRTDAVCAPSNPFAGITVVIAAEWTCDGTPVDNYAASSAKIGSIINANAVGVSTFFGRSVGTGNGTADCLTGLHGPVFKDTPEGCFPPPPPPPGVAPVDPCLGGPLDLTSTDPTASSGLCSPIILDLQGNGFPLTSAANGVRFDITGTGHPIQIAWTAPGLENGFLALDRNGNGVIDNGTELFGNFTQQPPSAHPNGFLALGVYDKPENGGNGDGLIDGRDAIFSSLRIWVDANHDGICQPEELHALPEVGVFSLSLNYTLSYRRDEFGNVFRYKATVNPGTSPPGDDVGKKAYDVFLVTH